MKIDSDQLVTLPIEYIFPSPYQPRKSFNQDSLEELAQSILSVDIIQPLTVRKINPLRYELIAGERRWRAAGLAGLYELPCIVKVVSDEKAMKQTLIENLQREELNPVEAAEGVQRLMVQFNYTHETAAGEIGRSRSYVSNLIRYLELPEHVKNYLVMGELEGGHAKVICGLPIEWQSLIADEAVKNKLSVRQLEELARNRFDTQVKKPRPKSDPNIRRLSEQIADATGCKNSFQHSDSGKGTLVFHYNSLDELEGLLRHLPIEK